MYVLIDFSNIAYLAFYHSLRMCGLKPEDVMEGYTEHIGSFKTKIEKIMNKCNSAGEQLIPVFALDQFPKWKHDLYPEYKAGRTPLKFSPKKSLLKTIENWGWKIIYAEGMEADDVIATFVARNCDDSKITVVTTDRDIWQVADHPNTVVLDPTTFEYANEKALKEKFGIEKYSQLKLVKALFGDPADNVKNNAKFMGKHLLPIIAKTEGDLNHFLDECSRATMSARCKEVLSENKEKIETNYKLVCLKYNCKILDHKPKHKTIDTMGR